MSFISDLLVEISSFRIRIGNKLNALKTLIDGKANIDGSNIPYDTKWSHLKAGGLGDYYYTDTGLGSNFTRVMVWDQGGWFWTSKSGMQTWLGLDDYVLKSQITTPTLQQVLASGNISLNTDSLIISSSSNNSHSIINQYRVRTTGGWARDGFNHIIRNNADTETLSNLRVQAYGSGESLAFHSIGTGTYNSGDTIRFYPDNEIRVVINNIERLRVNETQFRVSTLNTAGFVKTDNNGYFSVDTNDYALAGSLGNYLEKSALSLSPVANWDNLTENRIVQSTSGANSPFGTYGVGFNFYGGPNTRGQLFLGTNITGGFIQYRVANSNGFTSVRTVWDNNNFNPSQYVMISALNTTLANYGTLAGTQTFTGQNTYTQALIVPNGTLNGHAVNLGQLNDILDDYATEAWVTQQIANISIPNGQLTVNTTSDLVGGFVYLPNGNVTTTIGLSTAILNNIADGVTAYSWGNHANAGYTNLGAVQSWVNSQGYLTSAALNGYVLQINLNAQLANYVTVNSVQNITATKNFTASPVVPNGTLANHAVSKQQLDAVAASIPTQTPNRVYDNTDPINNDYWDKTGIGSVLSHYGFDICCYHSQNDSFENIYSDYGAPYLNDGILGTIALVDPQTGLPVIKGTVECQISLSNYIANNQLYLCLKYYRDTNSPTYLSGDIMMLSMQDIVSNIGGGSVEMFNGVIVLGVATPHNTLMVQHREF